MRSVIKIIRQLIAIVLICPVLLLAIFGLVFYYFFSLLHMKRVALLLSHSIYYFLCFWILLFSGSIVHIEGRENIPNKNINVIYTPNHNSIMDIPLLYFALRRFPSMMAKKELFYIPLLHGVLASLSCIKIKRNSAHGVVEAIQKGSEHIAKKGSLVIFPEGTRSKSGKIGTFKKGAFKIAEKHSCPIVPVVIKNDRELWEGANRFGFVHVYIKFLPLLETKNMADEEKKVLAEDVEELVKKEFSTLPSSKGIK